jgi:hypothetical protein
MSWRIHITVGGVTLEAGLSDTPTARAVAEALPLEVPFNTWGDEFYFEVPVSMALDDTATTSVHVGDIGYWPPGRAVAVFFGPTPVSTGDEPVPASKVNIIGQIDAEAAKLGTVKDAGTIRLEIV